MQTSMGWGAVGWAVTAHWHLQTKDGTHGLAHIHMEHGVGWVGMSTFIGTCKPRVAQIVHTELPVGWGGVGWDVKSH